jgi:hypothetical protein
MTILLPHTGANASGEWQGFGIPFQVSFYLDNRNQPMGVCITSKTALVGSPQHFDRILALTRELGCTRIESRLE